MFRKLLNAAAAILAFNGCLLSSLYVINPLQFRVEAFSENNLIWTVGFLIGSVLLAQLATILDHPISQTMIGMLGVIRWGISGLLFAVLSAALSFVFKGRIAEFSETILLIIFSIIGFYLFKKIVRYNSG
jgi:hypothetical protein